MIDTIKIANMACFGATPVLISGLQSVNYFYGANGAGKTSISRIIADETQFSSSCSVQWRNGTKLQTVVYNRDFIARNFEQSPNLPGVFTLGEENVNVNRELEAVKSAIDQLLKRLEHLNVSLHGNTENDIAGITVSKQKLDNSFQQRCWEYKVRYEATLGEAFVGLKKSAAKFKERVLEECSKAAPEELPLLSELEKRAVEVFREQLSTEVSVQRRTFDVLLSLENEPVLTKVVVGRDDTAIAELIKRLNSSDWVKEGLVYLGIDKTCPFCQQSMTDALIRQLNEYFDETYVADCSAISRTFSSYKALGQEIESYIDSLLARSETCRFLDKTKLIALAQLFKANIGANVDRLEHKVKEPSRSVSLVPLGAVVQEIEAAVAEANNKINANNSIVANIESERSKLKGEIWCYLVHVELKAVIAEYKTECVKSDNAVLGISRSIESTKKQLQAKQIELKNLERLTTSTQPTINAINALLKDFGFNGFSLKLLDSSNQYKIVRASGHDAKDTLSEGEKTFVTVLYFYHLLKGSASPTDVLADRVVVFDDPISSLDGEILFIVGSLIRSIINEAESGTSRIKQVFLLTHNIYFHKEVSHSSRRKRVEKMAHETFWIIRKGGREPTITSFEKNPIRTSYEMLWEEVRNPDKNSLTIQNTLRRILENYFKMTGQLDYEEECNHFHGQEKLVFKSLCSWVHDGSHHAHENLFLAIDQPMVATYLCVFRSIFEKLGHLSHYKMMMGEFYVEPPALPVPTVEPVKLPVIATGLGAITTSYQFTEDIHAVAETTAKPDSDLNAIK